MTDTDFERQNERYGEHLDKGWHKILTELEWIDLRKKFFEECVGEMPDRGRIVVILAPHDCFEWFKKNLCQ